MNNEILVIREGFSYVLMKLGLFEGMMHFGRWNVRLDL
jgi:hypothetical protein